MNRKNVAQFACILLLGLALVAVAQPEIEWSRLYRGPYEDWCTGLLPIRNGYLMTVGINETEISHNISLMMIDQDGDSLWSFPLEHTNYGWHMLDLPNGNLGLIYHRSQEYKFVYYIFDREGELLDSTFFNLPDIFRIEIKSTFITSDSNIIIAGNISDHVIDDIFALSFSPEGDSLWFFCNTEDWYDSKCAGAVANRDGGCMIAGYQSYNEESDIWLLGLDNGIILSEFYGNYGRNECYNIQSTDYGYVLLADFENTSRVLFRVDESGDSLGICELGAEERDAQKTVYLGGGDILLAGENTFDDFNRDIWLSRVSDEGEEYWFARFGWDQREEFIGVARAIDDGYAILGNSASFYEERFTNNDVWLVKTEADPVSVRFPDPGVINDFYLLLNAYPNPFNATTWLEFRLPDAGNYTLEIFNATGQIVDGWSAMTKGQSTYCRTWNAGQFPSGTYFGRLNYNNQSTSTRLILNK